MEVPETLAAQYKNFVKNKHDPRLKDKQTVLTGGPESPEPMEGAGEQARRPPSPCSRHGADAGLLLVGLGGGANQGGLRLDHDAGDTGGNPPPHLACTFTQTLPEPRLISLLFGALGGGRRATW